MDTMIEMNEADVREVSGGQAVPDPSILGFLYYEATGYINGIYFG